MFKSRKRHYTHNKTIEYEMIEEQRVIIELAAFMWETSI